MKLLAYHDGPGLGGSERSLATRLSYLDPAMDVVVAGVHREVVRWIADHRPGARVEVLAPVRSKWDVAGLFRHIQMVRRVAPDIMQVDLPMPWSSKYALLAGILAPGVRVVAVDHSPVPAHNREVILGKRALMAMTSANVAVSQSLAQHIESVVGQRRGSMRVIYNGIPDLEPRPAPRHRHQPPVVGTVARLSREKGIDVLLQALTRLPDVMCVVVGDGQERTELHRLARELDVADRVSWLGWREDARELLHGFDIFVLPSRFEGFGQVLVEAALAECPVVATDVIGTSEALVDGETGLLVPPEDPESLSRAIRELLDHGERGAEMGRRGRLVALGRFQPATAAHEYESLYREVLGRRRQGARGRRTSLRR